MVQHFLSRGVTKYWCSLFMIGALVLCSFAPTYAGKKQKKTQPEAPWPELLLDGGRKLTYEQTLTSQRDVRGKQRFWSKVFDVVAGEPEFKVLVRPYSVAVDSRNRVIVTDPGTATIHIFDIVQNKYRMLDRWDKDKNPMMEPQCVALDTKDNIYVTDSESGKIFVFDAAGKTKRVFGSLKGGEGFYKRPTGISIDHATGRVYVTDTLRDRVYILDRDGAVIKSFGKHGSDKGEFNLPTEVLVKDDTVAVVDAMNFRIQLFDREGNFRGMIGKTGDPTGGIFRPKGIAIDSEHHIYEVESQSGVVQVFDLDGRLLYIFGNGTGFGLFQLPAGVFIDKNDRVYLADSYNHRVQIFQYHALKNVPAGERH